jgi:hypothetical protein
MADLYKIEFIKTVTGKLSEFGHIRLPRVEPLTVAAIGDLDKETQMTVYFDDYYLSRKRKESSAHH